MGYFKKQWGCGGGAPAAFSETGNQNPTFAVAATDIWEGGGPYGYFIDNPVY